jgi:hypothetical protein
MKPYKSFQRLDARPHLQGGRLFAGMTEIIFIDIHSFIVIPAQAGIQKDYRIGLLTGSSRFKDFFVEFDYHAAG